MIYTHVKTCPFCHSDVHSWQDSQKIEAREDMYLKHDMKVMHLRKFRCQSCGLDIEIHGTIYE